MEENDSITRVQSEYDKVASKHLFLCAKLNAWDDLVQNLKTTSADIVRNGVDESDIDDGVSLLHVVLTHSKIKLSIIEGILDAGGRHQMAMLSNSLKQTPLHVTIHFIPERTEIVKCLIQAAPETIQQRDYLYLRPIDILCQKLIMMEEVNKYTHQHENSLDALWETAHLLAIASCAHTVEQQPILHSCLQSFDFPFALKDRAIKRYHEQLRQIDTNGDLPLHIIARQPPPPTADDDEGDFLEKVLHLYPEAASKCNLQNESALLVAIQSGRRWQSGISLLLEESPSMICDLDLNRQLYPLLFEKLLKDSEWSTVYSILQAKQDLV